MTLPQLGERGSLTCLRLLLCSVPSAEAQRNGAVRTPATSGRGTSRSAADRAGVRVFRQSTGDARATLGEPAQGLVQARHQSARCSRRLSQAAGARRVSARLGRDGDSHEGVELDTADPNSPQGVMQLATASGARIAMTVAANGKSYCIVDHGRDVGIDVFDVSAVATGAGKAGSGADHGVQVFGCAHRARCSHSKL